MSVMKCTAAGDAMIFRQLPDPLKNRGINRLVSGNIQIIMEALWAIEENRTDPVADVAGCFVPWADL